MRAKIPALTCVLTCVVAMAGVAQQGHPLAGIWLGDWGATPDERNQVVIEMMWETTTLSGTINPGFPDAGAIRVGVLDSSDWTVHLEADAMDEDGNPFVIVIDGQLGDLGSTNRTLSGTWRHGAVEGDFSLTRE